MLSAVWRFVRHEIVYILWALMEISLLAPLFLTSMPWARYWPHGTFALWLLLLMLIPFNLIRVMSLVNIPRDRQRIVLVGGLLLTIMFSLRALLYDPVSLFDFAWFSAFIEHAGQPSNPLWFRDIIVFIIVCFIWWRGISLAGRSIDIGDIGVRFRFGSLLLAVLIGGIAQSVLTQSVTPFILLFFLSSLMAIVLTRIEQLELNQSGRSFPLGPRWVLMVALAAFLIVFIIGILAGLAGGRAVDDTIGWLSPVWLALEFLGTAVIGVVSYLSTPLIILLSWIMEFFINLIGPALQIAFENLGEITDATDGFLTEEDLGEGAPARIIFPTRVISILVMAFFILLVSLAFTRLLQFLRPPSQTDSELVNPFENLSIKKPGFGRRLLNKFGLFRRQMAAASIRRIYLDMCNMAGHNGYPRLESETPYEFLKTLKEAWPEHPADTRLITEAYNRVRYGELPESQAELDEIEAAWKRLERIQPEGGQSKDSLEIFAQKEN
jgi:hypothetical protein